MTTTRFRLQRIFSVLLTAVLLLGTAGATTRAQTLQQGSLTDDFASQELGNPWDMSDAADINFPYTRDDGGLSRVGFNNGILEGVAANGDPRVWIRVPSNPVMNPVPSEGTYRPINADVYRYLTVRINVTVDTSVQAVWQATQGAPVGTSVFVGVKPGWQTVTIDMRASGNGRSGVAWGGVMEGLYLDPTANAAGQPFQIDFIRLSANPPGNLQAPLNSPPQLIITAPSYVSGPDYATTVAGNPWDMSDPGDIKRQRDIAGGTFSNGIFRGANPTNGGDPSIELNVPTPIDTSRFKYVTYRMQIDGTSQLRLFAPVVRYLWWTTGPQQATTTTDWVAYEGWQTVSFDLTKMKLEPTSPAPWTGRPTTLRFDPHEFTNPRGFQIDYVLLTGDNVASTSYDIRYVASDVDGQTPTVQLFYDTDAQGFNGQPITCASTAAPSPGNNRVFLPLMRGGSGGSSVDGSVCRWQIGSIPAGSYYVYGVVSDGNETTRTYSRLPVIVQR